MSAKKGLFSYAGSILSGGKGCQAASSLGWVDTWQVKADLMGLQNDPSLRHSCDARELWISEQKAS